LIVWASVKGPRAKVKQRLYQYMLDNSLESLKVIFLTCATKFSFLRTLGKYARYVKYAYLEDMPIYEGTYFTNNSQSTVSRGSTRDKDDLKRDVTYYNTHYGRAISAMFNHIEIDFADTTTTYYYLPVKRYRMYDYFEDGSELEHYRVTQVLNGLNLTSKLICIPFNYACHIKDKTNWINLVDYLEDMFKGYVAPPNVMGSKAVSGYVQKLNYKECTTIRSLETLGLLGFSSPSDDEAHKFSLYEDYKELVEQDVHLDTKSLEASLKQKIEKVLDKYPMLRILKDVGTSDLQYVQDYIKLVDKTKGTKGND